MKPVKPIPLKVYDGGNDWKNEFYRNNLISVFNQVGLKYIEQEQALIILFERNTIDIKNKVFKIDEISNSKLIANIRVLFEKNELFLPNGDRVDLELINKEVHKDIELSKRFENKELNPEEKEIRNYIRTGEDILNNGIPKIEWLVENIVRVGGITVFGGSAGTMKTFTGMYLSLCCANNIKFLEEFNVLPIRTLYIDEENGDIVIGNRLKSLIKGMNLNNKGAENISFSIFNNYKLDNSEVIIKLKYVIEKYQPQLIIFDSMVRCMEGEEDKSKDVRMIFDNLKEIFNEFGTSFILLHHTTKGQKGLNALRGSGDFAGMADVVLMFDKLKDGSIKATFEKNRHIDTSKLQNFNFIPVSNEENNSINFKWLGLNTESISKRDECMKQLIEFAKDKGSIGFTKLEAKTMLSSLGFSKSMCYETIKISSDSGVLEFSGKLIYFNNCFQTKIEEEVII